MTLAADGPYLESMSSQGSVIVSDVAVVGGGFCGALLAAHLLKRSGGRLRVALIERAPQLARGVAYRTPFASHLLNVPADRMSAWSDEPEHFLRWWRRREPGASGSDFAPRSLYGEYLSEQLRAAHARSPSASWLPVLGDAISVVPRDAGVMIRTREGGLLWASRAVLALGNLPPTNPRPVTREIAEHPAYRRDPWAPGALEGVAPDAPICLIGSGLTMVDVALALVELGHRGPIHALSRRGLLPMVHALVNPRPPPVLTDTSLRGVLDWLRRESEVRDWRAAVDALRPISAQLWMGFSTDEKRRFLRHVRPYWDTHRHRMAPRVGAAIEAMQQRGQLTIAAGHLLSVSPDGDQLRVTYRPRHTQQVEALTVARVINCTGPAADITRTGEPLLEALLRSEEVRPDPLSLGLDVTLDGRLLNARGDPSSQLFAAGPLCRGRTWEATAVPELREQVARLSELLVREATQTRAPAGAPPDVAPSQPV